MAPPPNDNFANAEVLSGTSGTTSGTTLDATHEVGEPAFVGINEQSVWYKITPGATGQWEFLFDNVVFVGDTSGPILRCMIYNATVDTLAEATTSNHLPISFSWVQATPSFSGTLKVQLYAGNTYYIRVLSDSTTAVSNDKVCSFDLSWLLQTGPANDDLSSAVSLSAPSDVITGETTFHSSQEDNEIGDWGFGEDQSVWYEFTPATTGRHRIYIDNLTLNSDTTDFRPGLSLYSGSSYPLTYIDKTSGGYNFAGPLVVRRVLSVGTSYKIKVYAPNFLFNDNITFDFDVGVDLLPSGTPPANDDFANAEELGTDPTGTISGSNVYATSEAFENANGYNEPSVWYHFTISTPGIRTVTVTKTGSDPDWQPYAEFYTDTGGVFDQGSDYFDSTGSDDLPTIGSGDIDFVAGDYYMAVYNWNFDGSWDDFEIEFGAGPAPPPANDNFTNRTILPNHYAVTVDGTTDGATTESGELNTYPGNINPPYPSVWYQYTTQNYNNQPKNIVFDTEGSPTDTYLEVFTGSTFGSLTRIASDHNSGAGGRSRLTINANGNVTYRIRVSSPPGSEGPFSLHINTTPGGTPPANDNFANAELLSGYTPSSSGTTVGATGEYDDRLPDPTFESTNTVWYKWIPPQTGRILLTVIESTENVYATVWRGTTLAGLVRVENIVASGTTADDAVPFQVEGGVTYYFKVEGSGGKEATFTIAIQMANVSPPANDDPSNAIAISSVNGNTNLTIPTEGALWDTVGPNIGDYVTAADENATVWWKFTTGDYAGTIYLTFNSATNVIGGPTFYDGLLYLYSGDNPSFLTLAASAIGRVGHPFAASSTEVSLQSNTTYWLKLETFYWITAVDIDMTLQFQDINRDGESPSTGNGTADFDSITGGFVADDVDGEFVASGAVGYGTISPWTDGSHYPYGWWCRFDLNSTSGDYLYRYGAEEHIEFFRATKDGGDYHSLYLIGSRDGTQSIWAGRNGSAEFNTGYRVFGLNKFGTSEKVRIEIGENGITIDERCFRHSDFDFPIFKDDVTDQFVDFDFGILNYPADGTSYVDLDPEWNLRFSNIRIHDNPDENVMGTPALGVKEVVSICGWTQGFDYFKLNSNSFRQLGGSPIGGAVLATVVASAGEYDGYSLDCSVSSTSATKVKGYGWAASNSQPGTNIYYNPYVDPANDSYFPGLSFRFWVDEMPSDTLVIAYIAGTDNGCYLYLGTDGTLYIRPSKSSSLIPFCTTEVDRWNYIEIQQDTSTRTYATKIWLQNVYMGRFETTFVPTATNTGVPNRPPMWNSYAIGRLGSVSSPSSSFSTTTVGIQFRDIATTRRKVDRPLGPTVIIEKQIDADGEHNYPDPDTFEPNVSDQGFNSDFSGGTDGAGQPHYWTGYDRHDDSNSFPPPTGAMYLGYLFRTFANGLLSVVSDTSGPPGLTSALAMRVEAPSVIDPSNPGAGAAYVFGGASEPAVDLVFDLNYADAMSAQFWVKGPSGKTISIHAETGIGDYDGFNSHICDGTWEHVRLWLAPQSITTTVQLQAVVLDFADASVGDVFLIKDFHLYLNPENNPPNFYESSDAGASATRVPVGDTNTYTFIQDMPPDGDTQIYTNTRHFLNLVRGQEDDGKTHLPPLWSDHYLEWQFGDYFTDNNQVFAAKIIASIKGFNGEHNTDDNPPDWDAYVQGGYTIFTIANSDGAIRYIGKHAAHIAIDDDDQTFYGIQLTRPPGNGEWNLSAWNDTQLRLMSHDKTFSNSLLIVGDFQGAGLVEGAVAEILTFDRKLSPPLCVRPIDLSRIRFRAYEEPAVGEEEEV